MSSDAVSSIVIPRGRSTSTCGYCSPPGTRSTEWTSYHSANLEALRLTCEAYQGMIDRGWRRSGTYCYKPDLRKSCCPQYTIKLDASAFKASKSQRKLVNRWNRFIINGSSKDAMDTSDGSRGPKQKELPIFSLQKAIHTSEVAFSAGKQYAHRFETILEPSSFTVEKHKLYQKYQTEIHNDHRASKSGFTGFLIESPLVSEPIAYPSQPPDHLPKFYGSYHQLYRLDGELIAMAVLDILPNCVSSVYFMYDKTWEDFSLGKLSALREVSLAQEMREAGAPGMSSLYMGFYIYSCQKMRYKGDYSPSYLADPETYEWYPLEECNKLLQNNRYACFSNLSHSIEAEASENIQDDEKPKLEGIKILQTLRDGKYMLALLTESKFWRTGEYRGDFEDCIRGLGDELSKKIYFMPW